MCCLWYLTTEVRCNDFISLSFRQYSMVISWSWFCSPFWPPALCIWICRRNCISSAIFFFPVATVNNKMMLFLLSVFPVLLLFALELELFALAILTQAPTAQSCTLVPFVKLNSYLLKYLPFHTQPALTISSLWNQKIFRRKVSRAGFSASFGFSPHLTKWEAGNPWVVTVMLWLRHMKGFLPSPAHRTSKIFPST